MKRLFCLGFIVLGIGVTAFAQDDVKRNPGYVDLDDIEIPDSVGEVTEVNLGPDLMRIAAPFCPSPPGEAEMKFPMSIRVKSFQTDPRSAERMKPLMEKIAKQLHDKNWIDLVHVKKKNEFTVVSVKMDKHNKQAGMMVMSVEPSGEVSFVNLVGNMDMNMLPMMGINVGNGFSAMDSLRDIKERQREAMEEAKERVRESNEQRKEALQEARERLKESIEESQSRIKESKSQIEEAQKRLKELEEEKDNGE
jgi:hypothetical protein